jgi:hypothetical protein
MPNFGDRKVISDGRNDLIIGCYTQRLEKLAASGVRLLRYRRKLATADQRSTVRVARRARETAYCSAVSDDGVVGSRKAPLRFTQLAKLTAETCR